MADDRTTAVPTHRLYARDKAIMEFCYWSHKGGTGYLSRYLTPHAKEDSRDFAMRLRRAVYPNLIKVQVSAYASQVYRSSVARTFEMKGARGKRVTDVLDLFTANADRMGNAADEFFEQVLIYSQRDGVCGVLVDRTRTAERLLTVENEEAANVRPYGVIVPRADLIDWEFDEDGRPIWALVRSGTTSSREPLQKASEDDDVFNLWTRTSVERVTWDSTEDGKWRRGDPIEHGLGVVPIEFVFWGLREGKEPIGQSAIEDLAPMTLRLVNFLSLIDEECYLQVFNMLVVGETTYDEMSKTSWSTSGVLKSSVEDVQPFYLAPDVATIEALGAQVNDTIRWVRILSGNVGASPDGGFVPPSGVSMSYQSSDKFALFKKIGGRMEDLEARVYALCALWEGGDPNDLTCSIAYPVDFDPVMVARSMEDSLAFASLGITGDALIEVQIQAIRRMLNSSLDPKRIDDICEDFRKRGGSQGTATQAQSGAGENTLATVGVDTATTPVTRSNADAGLEL